VSREVATDGYAATSTRDGASIEDLLDDDDVVAALSDLLDAARVLNVLLAEQGMGPQRRMASVMTVVAADLYGDLS
jgi:hypothetical protein